MRKIKQRFDSVSLGFRRNRLDKKAHFTDNANNRREKIAFWLMVSFSPA